MIFEDLDLSDPEVAMAYLEHPVTEALLQDGAREFARLPREDQREHLQRTLEQWEENRRQLVEQPAPDMPDESRLALAELLMVLDDNIEWAGRRAGRRHRLGAG